jgi:GNAT superfamily N-acetyltransferase
MVLTDPPAATQPANQYDIEQVTESGRLASVAALIASAFGLDRAWVGRTFAAASTLNAPGVRYFLATHDGQPWSTLTTTRTGSLVGIWSMATAPQHQRRGAGRAIIEATLEAHCAQGVGAFYLVATPAGKPLYDALGFTTLDDLAIWVAGESAQFGRQ